LDTDGFICHSGSHASHLCFTICGLTSRRSQRLVAIAVPLSRFTSRVGGGSAFFVRLHERTPTK
jgi:hypothetical protein